MNVALGREVMKFWGEYLAELPVRAQADFARSRYVFGNLPALTAHRLAKAIRKAPDADCGRRADRVVWSNIKPADLAPLLAHHTYKAMDAATAWVLTDALKLIEPAISSTLSHPWRVLNVRSWLSRPGAAGGPYEWHTDSESPEMLKLMIYATPIGGAGGGISFDVGNLACVTPQSAAGMWALFMNSALMHKANAPTEGERVATEVTLCAWPAMDTRPRFLGANVRHQMHPLMYAADEL